jgi:hypothetical protein
MFLHYFGRFQESPKQDTRLAVKVATRLFIQLLHVENDEAIDGFCTQLLDGVHNILMESSGETHLLVRW